MTEQDKDSIEVFDEDDELDALAPADDEVGD